MALFESFADQPKTARGFHPMTAGQGTILVIRGGAIGDFILTLPALAALRRQFPGARLEVLGYPHIVQLAIAGGLADRVAHIEARPLAGFFARGGALSGDLADYFSEFDLIISYLYDPDEIFQRNVLRCTRAHFIAGPHRPDEAKDLPAAKAFLKPLERLAIFDADPVPRLEVARTAGQFRDDESGPTLALHPGSGSETKNWPETNWAELLERLIHGTGYRLLLVGGEAEGERLQRLGAALPLARSRVAQSVPLAQLAGMLSGCAAFVGHDSGISHLAAAVGLPGVLLWGDTPQDIWRPPSEKMSVLRHADGLAALPVDDVMRQLDAVVADAKS